ncbi:MAG: 5'(3')-deoxyribonucleotidase [Bacteroidetes bacterium]|nr:MAG: 5'(3')-deoxyribonucleotidase [Bacteroidota bacterium]
MKKRLTVDMDGVLADVFQQFIINHERDFGQRKTLEEIAGLSEEEAFPKTREYVFTKGFFRNAPIIKDSQEILARLNEVYELFIVSAAMEFPNSLGEKQEWLNEHFSFIKWQQMVFCGSKTIIAADIMIDDHFKNLDHFHGVTYLFTQPHNKLTDPGRHTRVNSWQEIASLLL